MTDLKRRKRGFWALCLAAMLSLMPGMQTMAANASLGTGLETSDWSQEMPGPSLSNIGVNDTLTWSLNASGNSRVYYSEDPATILNAPVYDSTYPPRTYDLSSIYAGYEDLDADAISSWNATSLWTSAMGVAPYNELHITLTPVYKDYALTYQLDEGTNGANPASYTFITPDFTLADASKAHYTFGGWFKEATFATAVTSIPKHSKGNMTLYAKFTPETYAITYELDGGTNAAANPANYTYATGVASFADPVKEGYTFGGWFLDAAFTTAVTSLTATDFGAKTLYAKWTAIPPTNYTVTFDANGHGTAPAAQTVASGSKATEPAALTAEGYTFGGWYKEADCKNAYDFGTAVTADITLYAKWTENAPGPGPDPDPVTIYWVAFHANGHGVAPDAQNVPEGGKAVTPIPPTAEGYTFGGWYIDAPCTVAYNFDDPVTMNMTLYAKWTANGPSVPKTGDDLPDVGLWISLLGVGLAAVTAAVIRLRRCK